MNEPPTTLDDFRVLAGVGRVVLSIAGRRDDGQAEVLGTVSMTTGEARKLADDLVARAERVDRERR